MSTSNSQDIDMKLYMDFAKTLKQMRISIKNHDLALGLPVKRVYKRFKHLQKIHNDLLVRLSQQLHLQQKLIIEYMR